ncbi:MAG TPA: cytochrome c oxidase subunit II [Candidatus Polarisedimenticolia bacterium]|nr:cytochrome c oxidase subunit II [Candidatus Polarisedimenticolia bacterium]
MLSDLPLFPPQASTSAEMVDALYLFMIALTAVMSTLIAGVLIAFAVRYRRQSRADRTGAVDGSIKLELTWSLIPLGVVMFIFAWGASVFVHLSRPPDDTMDVLVVGKRWMWKLQHLNGRREINELHVPVGRAVKLTMTSEDVIHSFFVPAFRIKADVLPGRYTSTWFQATKPGRYHLFCAEYCGTKHSRMIGSVVVMQPDAFQAWLAGQSGDASPAAAGERLFGSLGCISCHNPDSKGRGPSLQGVFKSEVALAGGGRALADETYLRESIVDPQAKMVAGYEPLMPTFRGLVSEEGLLQLVEYIKTIAPAAGREKS